MVVASGCASYTIPVRCTHSTDTCADSSSVYTSPVRLCFIGSDGPHCLPPSTMHAHLVYLSGENATGAISLACEVCEASARCRNRSVFCSCAHITMPTTPTTTATRQQALPAGRHHDQPVALGLLTLTQKCTASTSPSVLYRSSCTISPLLPCPLSAVWNRPIALSLVATERHRRLLRLCFTRTCFVWYGSRTLSAATDHSNSQAVGVPKSVLRAARVLAPEKGSGRSTCSTNTPGCTHTHIRTYAQTQPRVSKPFPPHAPTSRIRHIRWQAG